MKAHFNYQNSFTSISLKNWCNYAPLLCSILGLKLDNDIDKIMNLKNENNPVNYDFTIENDLSLKLIKLHSQKVYVNIIPNIYIWYTIVQGSIKYKLEELEIASKHYDDEISDRNNKEIS